MLILVAVFMNKTSSSRIEEGRVMYCLPLNMFLKVVSKSLCLGVFVAKDVDSVDNQNIFLPLSH